MNTRNKPCSCGSGKKAKKCCFDEAKLAAQKHAAWEEARKQRRERIEKFKAEAKVIADRPPSFPPRRMSTLTTAILAGAIMGNIPPSRK